MADIPVFSERREKYIISRYLELVKDFNNYPQTKHVFAQIGKEIGCSWQRISAFIVAKGSSPLYKALNKIVSQATDEGTCISYFAPEIESIYDTIND